MNLFWAKAARGIYHLRLTPGGKGPAVGTVKTAYKGPASGSFYRGTFDHDGHHIHMEERAQPHSMITRMEVAIREAIPEATFTKEF